MGQGSWGGTEYNATWYDSNWNFRKQHTVNAAAGAGTGYQVRINVHYLNGTDSGSDVYLGGKCKGGFGDLRFTAMDGVTLLPYWMETPISDNATFWVKVSDNLSTQSAIIYLYYGNPAANSTSNGTATFDFYDDFTTNTGWNVGGNAQISCGTLNLYTPNSNGVIYGEKNNPNIRSDYRFRFRAATSSTGYHYHAYPRGTGEYAWANPFLNVGSYSSNPLASVGYQTEFGGSVPFFDSPAPSIDECGHVLQVLKSGYNYTDSWDDVLYSSAILESDETGSYVAFCTIGYEFELGFQGTLQVDWVFLSSFVSSEPAHGNWGAEEDTGSGAPHPSAVMSFGSQDYYESDWRFMGGTDEKVFSQSVSGEIQSLFADDGHYGYCADYWGFDSQPINVYNAVSHVSSAYSDSTFFYKGHSMPINHPGCGFAHFSVYDSEGYGLHTALPEYIVDYQVNARLNSGTFKFVWLWTCGSAWENATGDFSGGHSYGYMASWMDTLELNENAYNETTDNSGRCYIGFANFSQFFIENATLSRKYGDFVTSFFGYALTEGNTVRDALDLAARAIFDTDYFDQCPLYVDEKYTMYDPRYDWAPVSCWMVVRGDGDCILWNQG